MLRARRKNSLRPSKSSSPRIWWLSAAGVTCSSPAALEKLRCRAVASKARSALSGGRGRRMPDTFRLSQPWGEISSFVTWILAAYGLRPNHGIVRNNKMARAQHVASALASPHPAHVSIGRKAANLARHVWARYWTRRAAHATVAVLHSLDDRALKDIGLDRSEIESVVY